MEASAPTHPAIEPEPPEWQPRALWVGARLLCGAVSFFFVSFVFAYFYLRSLDTNKNWKIGHVDPSVGLGVAIAVVLVLSAAALWVASTRPEITVPLGLAALILALVAVVLQCIEYSTQNFGPANGAFASVYIGWTATYTIFLLFSAYWIETQVAERWRLIRTGVQREVSEGVPTPDADLSQAGIKACAFYWAFYVGIGVITFVILYLVT
jgi:heme/copper-type cytochrome/quinol oxidase subunit 3